MKIIITICISIICFTCIAQDTLETKLKQYKDLFEKGLINQAEYQSLKDKALQSSNTNKSKTNEKNAAAYKKRANKQIIGGSVFVVTATATLFTGLQLRNKIYYDPKSGGYKSRYQQGRVMIGIGIAQYGFAAILYGLSAYNRLRYIDAKTGVAIGILDNGNVGISYNF